jgi:hypothetical protein
MFELDFRSVGRRTFASTRRHKRQAQLSFINSALPSTTRRIIEPTGEREYSEYVALDRGPSLEDLGGSVAARLWLGWTRCLPTTQELARKIPGAVPYLGAIEPARCLT